MFVHAKAQEEKFVAEGWGVRRFPVMYNDFVLIGPKSDPAGVKGQGHRGRAEDDRGASAPFVSRGDKSGTQAAELALWKAAGIDIATGQGPLVPRDRPGHGAALNTASSMNGYTLSDRGTWLAFKNRGELEILVEGDKRLFNQYGVMLVNPEKHPHVKKELGQAFIDWLDLGGRAGGHRRYKINGEQLFFPNAGPEADQLKGAVSCASAICSLGRVGAGSSMSAREPNVCTSMHAPGSLQSP